jgi:hypothetical protein
MDEIILIKRNGKHLETRGTDQTTPDPITLVTLNQLDGGFAVCIQAKSRRQRGNRSGWSHGDAQRTPAVSSQCEEARGPQQPPVVECGIGKGRATRRGLRPAHKGRSWQSASGAQQPRLACGSRVGQSRELMA